MQAGSEPSTKCLRGTSALHHAAEANRTESIEAILKRVDAGLVHATDEMGWAALHYAALHQLPESAALLIQACSCTSRNLRPACAPKAFCSVMWAASPLMLD